jgi:hypothetical protein
MTKVYWPRVRRLVFCVGFLSWLSLAEWKIFERLLYSDPASAGFVVESVRGVLAGTPVSKSWQHRVLAPLFVVALGGARLEAVERFFGLTLLLANLLLFVLLRRRAAPLVDAVLAVVCLGLAHFVLAYKLEYPWDGIDQLIFVAFGAWAAQDKKLLPLTPILLLGTFNHETILYLPLWYVLSPERKQQIAAIGSAAVMGSVILATRAAFYAGQPNLPGQVFEPLSPVIGNHLHVMHNLRALVVDNWLAGRAHISVALLATTASFVWLALCSQLRRAAVWSLVVVATIVCFGYVNETRHYLVLVAFWVPYAWLRLRTNKELLAHDGADRVGVIADAVGGDGTRGKELERRIDPDLVEARHVGLDRRRHPADRRRPSAAWRHPAIG